MRAGTQALDALKTALEPIVDRERRFRVSLITLVLWAAILVGGWLAIASGLAEPRWQPLALLLLLAAVAVLGSRMWGRLSEPDYTDIARRLERHNPHLNGMLLTALEQQPDRKTGQLHFLQSRLLLGAVEDFRRKEWSPAVAPWLARGVDYAQWAMLIALLAFVSSMLDRGSLFPHGKAKTAATGIDLEVTPGDVTLERGSSLIVTAKFGAEVPGQASLVIQPTIGEPQRLPLQRNMQDPVFGGAIAEVKSDLTYKIAHDGRESQPFTVRVFDFPKLERADAQLHFPAFTGWPDKTIPETTRVAAVEGTKVDLHFQLNKPVKSAELIAKDGSKIPLTLTANQPIAELRGFTPTKTQKYEVRLTDADGRTSKLPANFTIDVLANRKPEIKIITPKGDQRVSPLQEMAFQTEVWDDFGLPSYGITYTVAGAETKEIALGRDAAGDQRLPANFLLKLEELGVQPDQLISWFAWAEDIGADGKKRRTSTDLYFAEVRPFEEIYRPGQAGEGQPQDAAGGEGQEAQKLAELQKQVTSATFKLQRDNDPNAALSEQYKKDVPVIRGGQQKAMELAQALREKLESAASQGMADAAIKEMQRAIPPLDESVASAAKLPAALEAEQGAYNALLKLAAHEFQVTRSKNSKGKQGQESRQQQLDQLELKEEKDRYETKQEAAPQQKAETREQIAVLNRLKELAQRQHDINQKLQELQTALQEAKTEQQKEALKKELKRLQEEQQQMLAEVDELQQKMQGQADPTKFAEERKKLEETRGEAQKANEALRQEKASEALAAGTRTERDLQKLHEDFRQKSSAQFNEQMRQMRDDARKLAGEQEAVGERLKENAVAKTPAAPTLDAANPNDDLAQRLTKQTDRLKNLQDEMKTVSEQAEAAEPLLSKQLYDALRKNSQADTDETLRRTGVLAQRGYVPQARQLNEKAGKEIDELKAGVERAAESVLGNEEESLKLARAELDSLTKQLNREIAANAPGLMNTGENEPGKSNKAGGSQQSRGENGEPKAGNGDGKPQGAKGEPQGKGEGEAKQPGESKSPGQGEGKSTAQNGEQGEGKSQGKGKGEGEGKAQPQSESQSPGQGEGAGKSQQMAQGKSGDQGQGQQPGEGQGKGGQQPGQGEQGQGKGTAQSKGQGQGQGQGEGQGQNQNASQSPGQSPPSTASAQGSQPGQGNGNANKANANPTGSDQRPDSALRNATNNPPRQRGGILGGAGGGGGNAGGGAETQEGPIRGEGYVQWSERLRNVEEMVSDPALRVEAQRIREVARAARAEFKRHSVEPKWDMIQSQVSKPLVQMRDRVAEELARRESKESLVPIDRDPVPPRFAEQVQRYYEVLGSDGRAPEKK